MHNGNRPIWVTAIRIYAGGENGSTSLRAKVGGTYFSTIGLPGASGGNLSGNMGGNAYFGNGGTTTISFDQYDSIYFGWNGMSGNTISADGGTEKSSATLTGAIEYVTACTAARSLKVTSATATSATLAWTLPADTGGSYDGGDIHYRIVSATNSALTENVKVTTFSYGVTSGSVTGLTPGTRYYFIVQASNNVTDHFGDFAPNSNMVNVSLGSAPATPAAPAATQSRGSAWITWSAPDTGGSPITDYQVYVGTSASPSGSGTSTGTNRYLNAADLAPGQTYYVAVRATNAIGTSAWSPVTSVTVRDRTTFDSVAEASVQVSGGYNVMVRSDGDNAAPTFTLGYSPIGSSTFTAIATLPRGTGSSQFAAMLTPNAIALAADPSGNLYVIGRQGSNDNGMLVKRYARTATTTWAASGTLAGAMPASDDALAGFAAAWAPGQGGAPRPTLLVAVRRAGGLFGTVGVVVDPAAVSASSGALSVSQANNPSWLSAPPGVASAATANRGAVDVSPVTPTGTRFALLVNDWAVVDVANGVVSSVAKAAASAYRDTPKGRVLGVSSAAFVLLDSADDNLNWSFISTSGSVLGTGKVDKAGIQTGDAFDAWDAFYNRVNGLVRVYYRPNDSDLKLNAVDVSPTTFTASAPVTLTTTLGAAGSDNGSMRVPTPPNDERSIIVEADNLASGTKSVVAYVDEAGNVAPTAPTVTDETGFDASAARTLYWAFGDPNPADSQTAYQVQIVRVSDSVVVVDTGKVAATVGHYTIAAATLTNGVNYQWRVRTYDVLDAAGTWSAYDSFTTSAIGTLTITDPAADDPEGLDVDSYTVTWTYEQADGYVQTKRRVRLLNATTGDVLSDTTMQASTDTSFLVSNLPSDVRVGIEVSVVTNAPGTPTVTTTRYLTTSYATPMTPELSLDTSGDAWVDVTVYNPDPDGSRPQIDYNEIWRSVAGLGQFERIGTAIYNGTFRDYSVASGASYDYQAVGVSSLGSAQSDIYTVVAPLLTGAWLLDPASPAGTIRQFPYAESRSMGTTTASSEFHFVGRRLPTREFGEFVDNALGITFRIPFDDDYLDALAWMRAFVLTKTVWLYRDNRGRKLYVTIDGQVNEGDDVGASTFAMTLTENDYDETA